MERCPNCLQFPHTAKPGRSGANVAAKADLAILERRLTDRLCFPCRQPERVIEEGINWTVERAQGHLDSLGALEIGQSADGFHSHARMFVVDTSGQEIERVFKT